MSAPRPLLARALWSLPALFVTLNVLKPLPFGMHDLGWPYYAITYEHGFVRRGLVVSQVALAGGCFQNKRLLEAAVERLTTAGFTVLLHRCVPPGDGGVALGQVVVAAAQLAGRWGGV